MRFIPPVIAGLVAADQENCSAAWVKGVQRSVGAPFVLGAQLAHVTVFGAIDSSAVRMLQIRAHGFKQAARCRDGFLLFTGKGVPPRFKLIGKFNFPESCVNYGLDGIFRQGNELAKP